MKLKEFESVKKSVLTGDYEVSHHSYGTCSSGYLVNFRLDITSKEHQKEFNKQVYFICFSSRGWYKVKHEGVFYNNHYLSKYEKYDDEIEAVIFGSKEKLSEKLTR